MLSRQLMVGVSAVGLLASGAMSQVAPPPPPPSEPQPEFVPPPMPRPRPQQAPQRPQADQANRTGPRVTSDLPDLPYPGLWEFCGTEDPTVDDVCTFEDNLHFVALRPNPTVSTVLAQKLQPVVVARRARFELMILENLNTALLIDGGMLQSIELANPTALQDILEQIKPFTPPSSLTQELQNRGIMSATQAKFNNKIISEYQRAYGDYLRRTDPDNATDRFMRMMFEDSLAESRQALDGMLHEARTRMDAVLEKVDGLPAEAAEQLRSLAIDSIEIDPADIDDSAEQVKLAWRPLDLDQKRQFLAAVRETRQVPDVPPVPAVVVEWAGKKTVLPEGSSVAGTARRENVDESRRQSAEERRKQEDDGDN